MLINSLFSSLEWVSSQLNAQIQARCPRVSAGASGLQGPGTRQGERTKVSESDPARAPEQRAASRPAPL